MPKAPTAARRLVRAAWKEIIGRSSIDLQDGRCRLTWGSRHIKRRRDWDLLFTLAHDRQCIFDVGAKVGMTAICMARGQNRGVVYAFEASELSVHIMNRNIALNALTDKVVAVNCVVGARSGTPFDYHWNPVSGRSGIVIAPPMGATPIQKTTVPLDDFAAEANLRPDLVKIDVEGGERDVLAGMQEIMLSAQPDIVVELHAWPGTSAAENASGILEILRGVGYHMYWMVRRQRIDHPAALQDLSAASSGIRTRARLLLAPEQRPPSLDLDGFDLGSLDW